MVENIVERAAAGKMKYGTKEIAAYLKIDRNSVSRLIATGVIVGNNDGVRGVCISEEELNEVKIFLVKYMLSHEKINAREVKEEMVKEKHKKIATKVYK